MANSSFIRDSKEKIIRDILADALIIKAMDIKYEYIDDIVGQNIFTFNQNPNSIEDSTTFITIQAHIPNISGTFKTWAHPYIEIWIISHNEHMRINNIDDIRENRNDYLSRLIDEKYNGVKGFGTGKLQLSRNIEGVHPNNSDFLFRQLVFEAIDLNNGLCRNIE